MSDVTRRAFPRRTGPLGGGLPAAPLLTACGGGTGGDPAIPPGVVTMGR